MSGRSGSPAASAPGLVVSLLARGRTPSSVAGGVHGAAQFRLCSALAARGRPIVRGRLRTGSTIVLDVRDPAHRELLWTGQTDPACAALISGLATDGWTVIDVGANAGFYSLLAWDLGGRCGRVLSFEPNPRIAALLRRSLATNAATGVELVEGACGAQTGRTVLHFSDDPSQAAFATLRPELRWTDDWSACDVAVSTIDHECQARGLVPDLVKIDAEGAEGEVIDGMSGLLARRDASHILCEVATGWGRPDPAPWIARLVDAGYDPHAVGDGGALTALAALLPQTVVNVCFVRRAPRAR